MTDNETLEETFDRYAKGKIEAKEKKMSFILKSEMPKMKAKLIKKYFDELVAAGFKKEEALTIICSGVIQI